MSLLSAPPWIQVVLLAEALALGWLVARFGLRGLAAGAAAGIAFWFVLGFAASFLVSRLEASGATPIGDLVAGAGVATGRVAVVGAPLLVLGALSGGLLRWLALRRKPEAD